MRERRAVYVGPRNFSCTNEPFWRKDSLIDNNNPSLECESHHRRHPLAPGRPIYGLARAKRWFLGRHPDPLPLYLFFWRHGQTSLCAAQPPRTQNMDQHRKQLIFSFVASRAADALISPPRIRCHQLGSEGMRVHYPSEPPQIYRAYSTPGTDPPMVSHFAS